ncbi:MAG: adenylate/guanylate cyclase domain-containing protein [Xanthomonadales bacterium]|nr:adenylate/guanylate cyclase domain-containing protein [Xanthomonadales bacterium]
MSGKEVLDPRLSAVRLETGRRHSSIDMTLANLDVCSRHCGTCPSYPKVQGEALFCATGKSSVEIEARGCNCPGCPLYDRCAVGSGAYFCKHGACDPADGDRTSGETYLARFLPPEEPDSAGVEVGQETAESLRLEFEDERVIEATSDRSILECALEAGIPMTHVCGGQAKCSTCRVLILDGQRNLRPRGEAEQRLATAKGLTPEVRLACQTRGRGSVRLRRLVLDSEDADAAINQGRIGGGAVGKDSEVAILFADIRSFTSFAERTLAYDLVHILNRYFEAVGDIADANGGYIDKYLGDGIMVVFGLDAQSRRDPSGWAVKTGLEILDFLPGFNRYLRDRFDHEFRIGIGICTGPAVVGSLGFHKKREYTAIGDTVNTAARIETLTKTVQRPLLVCANTHNTIGGDADWGERFETTIRGKQERVSVYEPLSISPDRFREREGPES